MSVFVSIIQLVCVFLFMCALYFPLNDSDALASYVGRYKYAEFGPLEQTATLSLQYVFPDGFNWIIYQFARTGYLAGIPSFICFLIILWILFKILPYKQFIWSLIVVFCSPLIITQSVSQKDDLFISSMFVLGLYCPVLFNPRIALMVGLFTISIMIGTKWNAIIYALVLSPWLLFQIVKSADNRAFANLFKITIASAPICWMIASGPRYATNYAIYGTPLPILSDVDWLESNGGFHAQLWTLLNHLLYNCLDVARAPLLLIVYVSEIPISEIESIFNRYSYPLSSLYTSHSPVGITYLLIFIGAASGLIYLKEVPNNVAISTLIAVSSGLLQLFFVNIGGGQLRYLLPALIGAVPFAAYGLERLLAKKIFIDIGMTTTICIVTSILFLSNDRTLPQPFFGSKASFVSYTRNHDLLMFSGLPGYISFYEQFQKTVHAHDSLMVVDNTVQADIYAAEIPHFYPFLLHRSIANTTIARSRLDNIENCERFKYILVYTRRGSDYVCGDYEVIIDTGFKALKLYRRLNT